MNKIIAILSFIIIIGTRKAAGHQVANMLLKFGDQHYKFRGVYAWNGPTNPVISEVAMLSIKSFAGCDAVNLATNPVIKKKISNHLPWVALVRRIGNCAFHEIAVNMANAGAVGVVIGNSVPGEDE
eukprot:Ihof_evm1s1217 gene=Ihof_evmTU1s1217